MLRITFVKSPGDDKYYDVPLENIKGTFLKNIVELFSADEDTTRTRQLQDVYSTFEQFKGVYDILMNKRISLEHYMDTYDKYLFEYYGITFQDVCFDAESIGDIIIDWCINSGIDELVYAETGKCMPGFDLEHSDVYKQADLTIFTPTILEIMKMKVNYDTVEVVTSDDMDYTPMKKEYVDIFFKHHPVKRSILLVNVKSQPLRLLHILAASHSLYRRTLKYNDIYINVLLDSYETQYKEYPVFNASIIKYDHEE